jgi:hypothetical protein
LLQINLPSGRYIYQYTLVHKPNRNLSLTSRNKWYYPWHNNHFVKKQNNNHSQSVVLLGNYYLSRTFEHKPLKREDKARKVAKRLQYIFYVFFVKSCHIYVIYMSYFTSFYIISCNFSRKQPQEPPKSLYILLKVILRVIFHVILSHISCINFI